MRWVSLAAFLGLLCFSEHLLLAAEYRLEIIAQEGDVIDGRTIDRFSFDPTNVAINNHGEIAFFAHATGSEGSGWSLMTQRRFISGAGKVVDGYVPGFNDEDHTLDMNEHGDVVYTPILAPGHRGVFVNDELIFQVGDVIDGRTIDLIGRAPQINDVGTVVVEAWTVENPGPAIFTQYASIAETRKQVAGFTLGDLFWPKINSQGEIVFLATFYEDSGISLVAPSHVLMTPGNIIGEYSVSRIAGVGGLDDGGRSVIHAIAEGPLGLASVILVGDEILWTSDQGIDGIALLGLAGANVVLNGNGDLAVLGEIDTGGGAFDRTIFAGDNLILREGDVLDGRIVSRVKANFDMNDRGDVAFRVRFDDETEAVVLANRIVPEPNAGLLASIGFVATLIVSSRQRAKRRHELQGSVKQVGLFPRKPTSRSQI